MHKCCDVCVSFLLSSSAGISCSVCLFFPLKTSKKLQKFKLKNSFFAWKMITERKNKLKMMLRETQMRRLRRIKQEINYAAAQLMGILRERHRLHCGGKGNNSISNNNNNNNSGSRYNNSMIINNNSNNNNLNTSMLDSSTALESLLIHRSNNYLLLLFNTNNIYSNHYNNNNNNNTITCKSHYNNYYYINTLILRIIQQWLSQTFSLIQASLFRHRRLLRFSFLLLKLTHEIFMSKKNTTLADTPHTLTDVSLLLQAQTAHTAEETSRLFALSDQRKQESFVKNGYFFSLDEYYSAQTTSVHTLQ